MIGLVSFKVGAASAQLADVSGIAADGYRAAFLVSVSEAERVVATSQPTPMPPHHKPLLSSHTTITGILY